MWCILLQKVNVRIMKKLKNQVHTSVNQKKVNGQIKY